jgi:hypothetical protein
MGTSEGFRSARSRLCIAAIEGGPSSDRAAVVVSYTNCQENQCTIPFILCNRLPDTRRSPAFEGETIVKK